MSSSKKTIVSVVVILLISSTASASVFDDIKERVFPSIPIQSQSVDVLKNQFNARIDSLNTPDIISIFDKELTDYGFSAVKIRVIKTPWRCEYCGEEFYIVKGKGIVREDQPYDREITVTYSQVLRAIPILQDGKIDFFERFQLYAIYKLR